METDSWHESIRMRLDDLRKEINFHNYRYHVLNEPVLSDYEFDQLMIELRELEATHPEWITPDSPTQRTGAAPSDKFVKLRHPAPILSLSNAFDADGVRAWYERILKLDERVSEADFIVEPKIDGLTVVLHYRNGLFVQGATRGDGEVGEDITSNLKTIRSLPLRIPIERDGPIPPSYLVVRGEAYIAMEDFELLNRQLEAAGEKTYQNPRNTAAGALRQLDPALTATRPLALLTYSIVALEGQQNFQLSTELDQLRYLSLLGFPVVEVVHCREVHQTIQVYEELVENRDKLEFEADGAVIKINRLDLAKALGVVGKDPRGSIAYKFPAQEVTTSLLDIGVNVGRTGVLTPFAILEPVSIGGVIVRQATLHNFDYIDEKDIRIGDRVAVKRAGDVIPYIIGSIGSARSGEEKHYAPPKECPSCGQPVEHLEGEVAWYCVNAACPAQLIRNVEHFVSRGAMDIVGLGIRIVEQLIATGLVRDIADLYELKKEHLVELDGFADKKADNLLQSIQSSKSQSLARLIIALGIRGVGEVVAADLADRYTDLSTLSDVTADELTNIPGIGPNIAQAIVDWFTRPTNIALLDKLRENGVWPTAQARAVVTHTLENLSFVVTGALPGFTRDEIKEFIEMRGGKVTDSISRKTDYLLVGENPGSKFAKAEKLGVPIINVASLHRLAGE